MKSDRKVYALVMGRVVSTLRARRHLTQQALAEKLSVGQATISRIERGTLIPDALLTSRLATAFGMSVTELLAHVEDGVQRTEHAAAAALGGDEGEQPWWTEALKVAGLAGLAGLAIFAVAAALSDDDE